MTNTAAAKRVTFVKVTGRRDYVDARFEVLLDGEVVGEVTRNSESVETSRSALSTSRIANYRTAVVWCAEVPGQRMGMDRRTRTDAAMDVLQDAKGFDYVSARIAVTGKAW